MFVFSRNSWDIEARIILRVRLRSAYSCAGAALNATLGSNLSRPTAV
jgi:hypothetical protein